MHAQRGRDNKFTTLSALYGLVRPSILLPRFSLRNTHQVHIVCSLRQHTKVSCDVHGRTCAHQLWLRVSITRLLDALADSVDPLRNVKVVVEEQTFARQPCACPRHVLHLTSVFASVGTGTSCYLDRASSFVSPTTTPLSTFLNKILRNVVAPEECSPQWKRITKRTSLRLGARPSLLAARKGHNCELVSAQCELQNTAQPSDVFNTMQLRVGSREIDGRLKTLNQMVKIL